MLFMFIGFCFFLQDTKIFACIHFILMVHQWSFDCDFDYGLTATAGSLLHMYSIIIHCVLKTLHIFCM